jgi:hypothetical protein
MTLAFCTVADVETYLGVTLTAPQAAATTALIPLASAAITAQAHHAWGTGPITAELYYPVRPLLTLTAAPVTSIEAVTGYGPYQDPAGVLLVPDTDYALIDPARGRLAVYAACYGGYARLAVDYTPAEAIPDPVRWGTAITTAWLIGPTLNGITSDVEAYSITGQLSVKLRAEGLPAAALLVLGPFGAPIVLAGG